MHFVAQDVAALIERSPYLLLSRPKGAVAFVRDRVEVGRECHQTLLRYPELESEPLEFYYESLRSLGALDRRLMEDLVTSHTWRGIVWGAWLALIDKTHTYDDLFGAIADCNPHNRWIVDTVRSGDNAAFAEAADAFATLIADVPRPETKLRPTPSPEQAEVMALEQQRFREIYKAAGSDAVLEQSKGMLIRHFTMSYPDWCRLGCPPPPDIVAARQRLEAS